MAARKRASRQRLKRTRGGSHGDVAHLEMERPAPGKTIEIIVPGTGKVIQVLIRERSIRERKR